LKNLKLVSKSAVSGSVDILADAASIEKLPNQTSFDTSSLTRFAVQHIDKAKAVKSAKVEPHSDLFIIARCQIPSALSQSYR
jgi:hypothetical protein